MNFTGLIVYIFIHENECQPPVEIDWKLASSCACLPWGSCVCPHWCPFPSSTCTAAFVSHSIFCGPLHHSHFHYLMLMFLYLNECLILIICCLAAVLFVDCDCEIRDCRFLHWTAETVFLDVVSLKIRCQLWSRSVSPVAMIWTSVSLWAGWCDHWIHKRASFVTMRSWFLIIYVSWWWVILVTCL